MPASGSTKLTLQNRIRSFIFFNNSAHNMILYLGGSNRNPDGATIPPSTSVNITYHDLVGLNFYTLEVTGTSGDTALLIWVEDTAGSRTSGTPIG
jgi:hypothetical protein